MIVKLVLCACMLFSNVAYGNTKGYLFCSLSQDCRILQKDASGQKKNKMQLMKTRRVSTNSCTQKSFILVDHKHGFIFTSFHKKAGKNVKAKKIKRFKKGILSRRIMLENNTSYRLVDSWNGMLEHFNSLVHQSLQLLVSNTLSSLKFSLSELFNQMDPVFNT